MPKQAATRLSVFKGREAKFNRAIFQTLALKGPLTSYDIHRNSRVFKGLRNIHYGNVNRRVRALLDLGYVKESRLKGTKAGFTPVEYDLAAKGYLALAFDSVDLEVILDRFDEKSTYEMIAVIFAALMGKERTTYGSHDLWNRFSKKRNQEGVDQR